jgi:hypothetical protein
MFLNKIHSLNFAFYPEAGVKFANGGSGFIQDPPISKKTVEFVVLEEVIIDW